MKQVKLALTLGVALTAIATPTITMAQSGSGEEVAEGDIIVTARRVEERLQDVPISITVFSQNELDDRNVTSGTDLAAYTPSLSVNTRAGSGTATFAIRGFNQETRTTASVSVYFADVVAPRGGHESRAAGDGAGPGAFFDLENVQVLKGPQGTLFGRNTTGGAILLVPTKPKADLGGYVEGSYGNFDMKRLQGMVNIPLSDTFRVRVGGDWMKREGYLRNVDVGGADRLANTNYYALRASIVGDLAPNLETYTLAYYTRSKSNGDAAKLVECFPAVFPQGVLSCQQIARQQGNGFYIVQSHLPDPNANFKQWQIINTTTWQASDSLTLKNIISYGEYEATGSSETFGTNWIVPPVVSNNTGTINLPAGQLAGTAYSFSGINARSPDFKIASQSAFTEELRFEGTAFNGGLTWQAGLYMEVSRPLGFNQVATPSQAACTSIAPVQCVDPIGQLRGVAVGNLGRQQWKTAYTDHGVYGQGTFSLTEQLKLTGGLRYTWNKTKAIGDAVSYTFVPTLVGACRTNSNVFNGNLESCRQTATISTSAPTWLVGLDYKPIDELLLYAKYSRGYRQGSTSILAAPGFQSFGPEKVDVYEVGSKVSWRGAVPGYFNVSGFYNDFSNQQLTVGVIQFVPFNVNSATLNVGRSRIYGVELEGGITPFEGLKLSGSYAYLNTKVTELEVVTPPPGFVFSNPVTIGQDLPLTPKHKYTLNGSYTLPLPEDVGEVSLGATYTYQSSALVSGPNRLPSYGLLNLNLNWDAVAGSPIDLSLFATNVTKKKYITYINDNRTSGFISHILGMPRMYGVRLRYSFGN